LQQGLGTSAAFLTLVLMDVQYSTPRKEGRGLEHELAGDSGFALRMKKANGKFDVVRGALAKEIRKYMRGRVAKLIVELQAQGLHMRVGAADCPLKLGEETRSVDARLWSGHHNEDALVEVKWTRRSLDTAHAWGWKSVPWLKQACRKGIWQRGRKAVKAGAVGVLVVRPGDLRCTLISAVGAQRIQEFPRAAVVAQTKCSRGKSIAGNEQRKGNEHLKGMDKLWRKTDGKKMTRSHEKAWRQTEEGKAYRRRKNAKNYKKRKMSTRQTAD